MSRVIPHSPNTPLWRGAQLKHRENFTFTLFIFTHFVFYTWISISGIGYRLTWTWRSNSAACHLCWRKTCSIC